MWTWLQVTGASPAPPRLLWLASTPVPGALSHLGSLLIMQIPRPCFQTASSRWLGWGPGSSIFIGSSENSGAGVQRSIPGEVTPRSSCSVRTTHLTTPYPQASPRSSCFFTPSSPQPRGCFAQGTLKSWPEPMFHSGPFYVLRNRGVQRRPGPMHTAEPPPLAA